MKKHLGFLFNIAALGLFVPGILLPMFSLNTSLLATVGGSGISSEIVNKELSLIATITELWQDERLVVATLIFLFSICIPVLKTILVSSVYFIKSQRICQAIINFVANIGKWSMADVFVVAVFLAVLSTNHANTASKEQVTLFGFKIDILVSSETLSMVGPGFYYFTCYCLVSLLATQLMQSAVKGKSNGKKAAQTNLGNSANDSA